MEPIYEVDKKHMVDYLSRAKSPEEYGRRLHCYTRYIITGMEEALTENFKDGNLET